MTPKDEALLDVIAAAALAATHQYHGTGWSSNDPRMAKAVRAGCAVLLAELRAEFGRAGSEGSR